MVEPFILGNGCHYVLRIKDGAGKITPTTFTTDAGLDAYLRDQVRALSGNANYIKKEFSLVNLEQYREGANAYLSQFVDGLNSVIQIFIKHL